MERVSIIMPCYNDGLFIEQAVNSVKNQTYKNMELVIIDDGSDDIRTVEVLRQIAQDGQTVMLHANHSGPASARNYGIQRATGKYILPLDADDTISETYVEKAVSVLENREDIGAVYCQADLFGQKKGRWELPEYSFRNMLIDNVVFVTAMFRKSDWEEVGGFDVTMDAGMEDYAFWISILALEKEIYQIPEILFHYRIKKQSRTTRFLTDVEQTKIIYRRIYHSHKEFYEKHAEEYAMALRDTLIEQIYIRRKYERRFDKLRFYKKIPVLRWIIPKILKNN